MREEFRPGDRVRVTRRCRVPTYHDGEGGTVADGPYPYPSGAVHYLVALDRGGPDATPTLFLADEIEADEDGPALPPPDAS